MSPASLIISLPASPESPDHPSLKPATIQPAPGLAQASLPPSSFSHIHQSHAAQHASYQARIHRRLSCFAIKPIEVSSQHLSRLAPSILNPCDVRTSQQLRCRQRRNLSMEYMRGSCPAGAILIWSTASVRELPALYHSASASLTLPRLRLGSRQDATAWSNNTWGQAWLSGYFERDEAREPWPVRLRSLKSTVAKGAGWI